MKRNSLLSLLVEFIVLPICYIITAVLLLALLIFFVLYTKTDRTPPPPPGSPVSIADKKNTDAKPSEQPDDKKKTPTTPRSTAEEESGSEEKQQKTGQPDSGTGETPASSDRELAPEQNIEEDIKEDSSRPDGTDKADEAVPPTSPGAATAS